MNYARWSSLLLLLVFGACQAAADVVERQLRALSLERKAGQLFMSWSLARPDGDNHERLLRWVEEVGLGGVILSLGSCEDAAALIPRLQAKAQVPLLLAGDFEGGVWFRLEGATELGNQMLIGATGSPALAERAGRVTAEEAKALGFHWVFAPVLDVNSNPDNPIINVRSFGEDPQQVAVMGAAFARGVRQAGLIACGKHFPGHGDVDRDSHLQLPTVPGDRERLHRVELHPFAVAAREGLESVMTGHLAVPGLGESPDVPATLSRRILHDVLREELGFTGLVVTDALDMGGVKHALPPGEVAVRALLAGADVLLMPPDPLRARQAVVDAVNSGRVPMARLDDAVRRIIAMKARVGLLAGRGKVMPDWRRRVRTEESLAVAEEIAAKGPVLVRNRDAALQTVLRRKDGNTLLVTLVDRDEGQGDAFVAALRGPVRVDQGASIRLSNASSADEVAAAVDRIAAAENVVLAVYVKVRAFTGGLAVPANLQPVLDALTDEQSVVLVSFGNPYLVRSAPRADAYVAAFTRTAHVQRAVASALLGRSEFVGKLPVRIPGVAAMGDGVGASPAEPELQRRLRERLDRAVAAHAFPGAQCLVLRGGDVLARVCVGGMTYDADSPPAREYDLASLTKVCATTPTVLKLVADGRLSLDDPVQKWVPEFVGDGKDAVTIRHLMAHQGGLPSYVRFFRTLQGRREILRAAAREGLMLEPGTAVRYSDLGFMLLMAVVEAASGEPFEDYVRTRIWQPLGMSGARFVATSGPPLKSAAPTERDPARGGIVHGYVHDENAYAMGGVSGHAGMFATVDDVANYGRALLSGGGGVLPPELVAAATRPSGIGDDTTRGLGFQLLQSGSYGGTDVPAGTFGHTGFTGTSLWCCPRYDACVVLLTNRVYPTRVNNQITAVRRDVHDLVLAALR